VIRLWVKLKCFWRGHQWTSHEAAYKGLFKMNLEVIGNPRERKCVVCGLLQFRTYTEDWQPIDPTPRVPIHYRPSQLELTIKQIIEGLR
jgi:hypothetical protein